MVPPVRMCVCNMYKYLLLEFMYMMCVNVLCGYLFVYLLQVMGCSSCCVVLCVSFMNACWDGLILSFIMCMCTYLMFNSYNTSNFGLQMSVCVSFMCNLFLLIFMYDILLVCLDVFLFYLFLWLSLCQLWCVMTEKLNTYPQQYVSICKTDLGSVLT
jgi:hypothetical protein